MKINEPQVILFQGMRGAGKGVAVDKTAEDLYKQGINIWHIWGARSFENLYWAINKDCKKKYDVIKTILKGFEKQIPLRKWAHHNGIFEAEFEYYFEIMKNNRLVSVEEKCVRLEKMGREFLNGDVLYCNCHKSYPILWIVPDYVEINQESLDRFNDQYWKNLDEYRQYLLEITTKEKQLLLQGKLKKPKQFTPTPKIIVKTITPPTNSSRKETFQKQFTEIVLKAREERRIVVMNPAIFEGSDKFDTLTEIIRMVPYLMNKSGYFRPLTEDDVKKPRKYWTKKQQSWHKVAIVINELRSVAPSSRLSGEKDSSKSKKAIYDFIPEARHYKTWFLGDYQNPDDLYAGVRYQANIIVIKRASRSILGPDWAWLFDKINSDRMGFVRKRFEEEIERPDDLWKFEQNSFIKKFLDERRPRISELPDNLGYITFINGEIKRWRFDMPSFHHKTSLEDFMLDTGITWKVIDAKKPKSRNSDKEEKKKSRTIKEEILQKIHHMHVSEKKSFKQIKDDLVQQEKDGIIPDMGYEDKDPIYFNNLWNRWKKKSK